MAEDAKHEDLDASDEREDAEPGEIVDGDGPGGESDVEVMVAPQLDDEDSVKISHTEDPSDDPDEEKPAVGHEAEAAMALEDPDPGPPVVTTQVPPVVDGALSAEEAEEAGDDGVDGEESDEAEEAKS